MDFLKKEILCQLKQNGLNSLSRYTGVSLAPRILDAKAADFDTSALVKLKLTSVEAPANEPVAEEVAPEPVATEEVAEQDDIADVAETAEDAVAEQASSESPFGAEAFSEAPVQQPTPQFDSSMFEKAPISSAQGFGTVPNPTAAGSADKPLFNLILPIVAIAFSVIFAILAWFVSPAWVFIILTVLAVAVAVVSLVFSLKSSKKLFNHRNRCCWFHALYVYWWFDFPNLSKC